MALIKTYNVTISNFAGLTPCSGYYIYTGLTSNINNANYINGNSSLISITGTTYTFQLNAESSITSVFIFIKHCEIESYKMSLIDLRCSDCVMVPSSPTPTPTITSTPTITPTATPTITLTPTPTSTSAGSPTPTPTPSIGYKSWNLLACNSTCAGVLGCYSSYSITVYTLPSVTSITNPSTVIYTNTSLTITWGGFFQQSGHVYDVTTGTPSDLGTIGIGC